MGKSISFGIQKGGVGKTTTAAITSFLLAKEAKVLAVDFDHQGNLTQIIARKSIYEFSGKTVLEAVKDLNARPYIYQASPQLHLLPAEDLLAGFSQFLSQANLAERALMLKKTLQSIKSDYDYIIIDLPPNLGDQTINGLTASDYTIVMLQTEPFCYDALGRYLDTLQEVKAKSNPNLKLAGILTTMMDTRGGIDNAILEQVQKEHPELVFASVIKRRSRIKEFSITGIRENSKVDREALAPFENFIKELKERV